LILIIVYAIVFCCNRDKIRVGIVLLETASKFVAEKPTIFIAPFLLIINVLIFEVFWLISLVAIVLYKGKATTQE